MVDNNDFNDCSHLLGLIDHNHFNGCSLDWLITMFSFFPTKWGGDLSLFVGNCKLKRIEAAFSKKT